jgi:hypothetical protein
MRKLVARHPMLGDIVLDFAHTRLLEIKDDVESAQRLTQSRSAAGGGGGLGGGGLGGAGGLGLGLDTDVGRGLHSFTFQLNLSRFCHRKIPCTH